MNKLLLYDSNTTCTVKTLKLRNDYFIIIQWYVNKSWVSWPWENRCRYGWMMVLWRPCRCIHKHGSVFHCTTTLSLQASPNSEILFSQVQSPPHFFHQACSCCTDSSRKFSPAGCVWEVCRGGHVQGVMTAWGRDHCLEVFVQCLKELAVDLWREEGAKQKERWGGEEKWGRGRKKMGWRRKEKGGYASVSGFTEEMYAYGIHVDSCRGTRTNLVIRGVLFLQRKELVRGKKSRMKY